MGDQEESVMEEESTIESTGTLDNVAKSDSNETSSFQSSPSLDRETYVWSEVKSDETNSSEDCSADSIKEHDACDDVNGLISGALDTKTSFKSEAQAEDSPSTSEEENVNTNCAQDEGTIVT